MKHETRRIQKTGVLFLITTDIFILYERILDKIIILHFILNIYIQL